IVGLWAGGRDGAELRRAAGSAAAGTGGAMEADDYRSGTGFCEVAFVRGRTAHGARVAGRMLAAGTRAVACIGGAGIAVVCARGARVAGRVLAGVAGAVALVEGAGVAVVGAGRPGRQFRVGRAGGARACAGLPRVAFVCGRSTHGARVARRVLAGGAGAVALVQGAG